MAIAESVHIQSVQTMSNQTVCVYNMAIKRNNAEAMDAPTMPSGMGFASIMVQSAIALSLSVESHYSGREVQISLQMLVNNIFN